MNKPGQLTAMISSTAIDLPGHRKQVFEACLREGIFPVGMEQLPARDSTAVQASLEMVDKADIYIGIYAWRYGWVPDCENPKRISVTEMEFNRALERKGQGALMEILIFLMDEDHPIRARDKEDGAEAQAKLKKLKERASIGRVRVSFKSAEELRGHVVQSLADAKARIESIGSGVSQIPDFHPLNIIPKPPEPYFAHPYSLLQTKDLVGRQAELNLLTDWVTNNKQVPADTRIFSLVAIGGMGKSALSWKWFNDIAPNELPGLAGRIWWSFYESDAHWENFIIRALAYVSGQSERAVREVKSPDREDQLLRILDQQPFLLVLDGLERILLAYARMDAAQMLDDDLDEKTANVVATNLQAGLSEHQPPGTIFEMSGGTTNMEKMKNALSEGMRESYLEKHQLRRCTNPYAGRFLRQLAHIRASRVLISNRLYPAELQTVNAQPLPGCSSTFLKGLSDDDAMNLWRAYGVSGTHEQLLPVFHAFGNHPLLIRALAGEVADYRSAPGNFSEWRAANPAFSPEARLHLKDTDRKSHVLEFALRGLKAKQLRALHIIAAFRMPATWQTLRELLVQREQSAYDSCLGHQPKAFTEVGTQICFSSDLELDVILTELEDRGLVGWDRHSNRYDLHPVVRSIVQSIVGAGDQRETAIMLLSHFTATTAKEGRFYWREVSSIDQLTPWLEIFYKLVQLGRYDEACNLFALRLDHVTLFRLHNSQLQAECLSSLTRNDYEALVSRSRDRFYVLTSMARALRHIGQPGRAVSIVDSAIAEMPLSLRRELLARSLNRTSFAVAEFIVAAVLAGQLRKAHQVVLQYCRASRPKTPMPLGVVNIGIHLFAAPLNTLVLAAIGGSSRAAEITQESERVVACGDPNFRHIARLILAQASLWMEAGHQAIEHVRCARKDRNCLRFVGDAVRAARFEAVASVNFSSRHLEKSGMNLRSVIKDCRKIGLIEEELTAISALAEWHRQKREFTAARELLEQIWIPAEHGPYPLWHADALNVLTRVERDQGNRNDAIAAATKAFTLAWCDGPPYAYYYGLTNARKHLQELGAPEPQLAPFDSSKFEPMPA